MELGQPFIDQNKLQSGLHIFIMKSSSMLKPQSSPRRPSPDQTSSPDRVRKTNILHTSSPQIKSNQLNKSSAQEEIRIIKEINKKLEEETVRLNDKNQQSRDQIQTLRNQIKVLKGENKVLREETTHLLGSDYKGISISKQSFYKNLEDGKPRKLEFESLTKESKQYIFQEFNRQMAQMSRMYQSKINQIQFRLDKISSSHKKVCEYLVENKIHQINFSSRKDNSLSSPRLGQKPFRDQQPKTAIKHQTKQKNLMKQLEAELLRMSDRNKSLTRELERKENIIKQSMTKNRGRKHSLQDMRMRQSSKISILDLNQSQMNYSELKKECMRLAEKLQIQQCSKEKSERALEVVQNNYELSQENLELIKRDNEKLKQTNSRLATELDNNKKVIQKMSSNMIRTDSTDLKKQRHQQYNSPPKQSSSCYLPPEEVLVLKNKIKRLQYQNQQLYLLRKRYQEQNITLFEQIRSLEGSVNRYLYPAKEYKSQQQFGNESRRRDPQFEMIQRSFEGIANKLRAVKNDIRGDGLH